MNSSPSQPLSLKQVLICGAMIVTLSMGIRHGFGLWLQPITQEQTNRNHNHSGGEIAGEPDHLSH